MCKLCLKQCVGAAIQGYDGAYYCMACIGEHHKMVLQESGESAPVESDNVKHLAARVDEAKEKKRQERAARMVEKYGAQRRKWS